MANIKISFLAKKYNEILLLDAMQNFSANMQPFFNQDNFPFIPDYYSSIMSGDSPTSASKENVFNYSGPGRSTPPPTTSYLASKQEIQPLADAVHEPSKNDKENNDLKDGKKDETDISSPDSNPGYKPPEGDKQDGEKRDDFKDGGGGDSNKINGGNKMEGTWVHPIDAKPDEDSDNECVVSCLYYTLQCCECTIT